MTRALYRGLLRLLPRRFRRSYAEDVEAAAVRCFSTGMSERQRIAVACGLAWDVIVHIPQLYRYHRHARVFVRERRSRIGIDSLRQDIAYALRTLRGSPGFALVAVLTLGLGIGATTTIFSVVHAVLLRPLPYRNADRLANIWVDLGVGNQSLPAVSPGDFQDYQQRTQVFESFAAAAGAMSVGATGALSGAGTLERVDVSAVTANFFPLLGVDPAHGRHFLPEEEAPNGARVVILSNGLWQRRYGADPSIVGRTIEFDGVDHLVAGVMPHDFRLLLPAEAFLVTDAQIWKPLQLDYSRIPPRNFTYITVFGRLKPDASFEQAQSEMHRIARELRAEHPIHESSDMRIRVVPLQHDIVKHAQPALVALFGAVAFVLLIACANVANLLLARATAREREIAVRGALGASGGRLLRLLVTESLVLAALGGLLGTAFASAGLRLLVALNPANLPRLGDVRIDGTVLFFAVAATGVTALLAGAVPALRAARLDVNRSLRASAHSAGRGQLRLRSGLVVAEIAMALVLLIAAGLMVRSFAALQDVRPGFQAAGALSFRVAPPFPIYPRRDQRVELMRRMEEAIRRLPGVTAVGMITQMPLTGSGPLQPYAYDEATARNWESATAEVRSVSPDYFASMQTRLLAGRVFDLHDGPGSSAIIIDETLAARAWPGQLAVGKRLQIAPDDSEGNRFAEVIGVVEHVRMLDLTQAVRPQIYRPLLGPGAGIDVVVRAGGDPGSLAAPIRQALSALYPNVPLDKVRPLTDYVDAALAQARLNLVLMATFGGMALALAALGIYGVISYSVGQRTREIGIRMALGQQPHDVRNLIIGQGLRLVGVSIALGLGAAWLLSRFMTQLLYQTHPADPATFAAMAVFLVVVAIAGCYVPARRATTINPIVALRTE